MCIILYPVPEMLYRLPDSPGAVHQVCLRNKEHWPAAHGTGQQNGERNDWLWTFGCSHNRWVEGWTKRVVGWPSGADRDPQTDAGSIASAAQVFHWMQRGIVNLWQVFIRTLSKSEGLVVTYRFYLNVLIVICPCVVGDGSDCRKDEAAARGEVLSSQHHKSSRSTETHALFWTCPSAISHTGKWNVFSSHSSYAVTHFSHDQNMICIYPWPHTANMDFIHVQYKHKTYNTI